MKILWFTNTPSLYKNEIKGYNGGGWISSLEYEIKNKTQIELGIVFLSSENELKIKSNKVTYYPIKKKSKNKIKKLIYNWTNIDKNDYLNKCLKIVDDFQPDVIQIFGTEEFWGEIQNFVDKPCIIHLQGILNPYLNAYYPPGFNNKDILLFLGFLKNNIFGNSIIFDKIRFEQKAVREIRHFRAAKNIMGRTKWDQQISNLLSPNANYYHLDEMLRPIFYESLAWRYKESNKYILISTLSETIYKGIDLILKSAFLLKKSGFIDFEWNIVGINPNSEFFKFFEKKLSIYSSECNIKLLGVLDEVEIVENILNSNVFVHPSYIDNSPNSICEAQMLGIPIVACNAGGVATLVEDNVSGILVPTNSPYELTSCILRLLKDEELSTRLGFNARRIAFERHNKDNIITKLLSIYSELHENNNSFI